MELQYKQIDYKTLPSELKLIQQIFKEEREFAEAIANEDIFLMMDKFHEINQSKLTIMQLFGITDEMLEKALEFHYIQLEASGHKFK